MLYIPGDMSKDVAKAKRAIEAETLRLYQQMPIEEIYIKTVCDNLDIARTTFYYHFSSIREVIEAMENEFLEGLTTVYGRAAHLSDEARFFRVIAETKNYLFDNYDFMKAVLVDRPDATFIDRWTQSISDNMKAHCPNDALKRYVSANVFISLFVGAIKNNTPKDHIHPEALVKRIYAFLSSPDGLVY